MLTKLRYGLEKASPVLIQDPKYLLRYFGWQDFVSLMGLHASVHLMVVEIDPLKDEGLSYLVVGGIVQIFGSKSSLIYGLVAGVTLANNVLLNQLHVPPPIPAQSSRSCVWHGVARTDGRKNCRVWR